MPKVSATASMGLKLKIFSDFENVSPHISISVEKELTDDRLRDDEDLVEKAGELYQLCRKYVQDEMEKDIASAKSGQDGVHIGRKVK